MQRSAQASHTARVKDHLISTLTALQKVPGQEKNAASMLKAAQNGHLPNGWKPVLYAIGGKAGLGTVDDYDKELQKRRKQDPKVKHHYYCWNAQMMAGAKPTPPPAQRNQAQLAQYAYCDRSLWAPYGHDIIVEFRCPASDGGDERVIRRAPTLNDTGSNAQSIHRSDWNAIKPPGMVPQPGLVASATGEGYIENVFLDIRIVKPEVRTDAHGQQMTHYTPLTIWFREMLILTNDGDTLLSGEKMRNYLYFATAPGNNRLLISQRKQAIIQGLDVVQPPLP